VALIGENWRNIKKKVEHSKNFMFSTFENYGRLLENYRLFETFKEDNIAPHFVWDLI
jgi:hypothetical protein